LTSLFFASPLSFVSSPHWCIFIIFQMITFLQMGGALFFFVFFPLFSLCLRFRSWFLWWFFSEMGCEGRIGGVIFDGEVLYFSLKLFPFFFLYFLHKKRAKAIYLNSWFYLGQSFFPLHFLLFFSCYYWVCCSGRRSVGLFKVYEICSKFKWFVQCLLVEFNHCTHPINPEQTATHQYRSYSHS